MIARALDRVTIWSPTLTYEPGDRVTHAGVPYVAAKASRGEMPGRSDCWARSDKPHAPAAIHPQARRGA